MSFPRIPQALVLLAMAGPAVAAPLAAPLAAQGTATRPRVDTTYTFARDGTVELGIVAGEIVVTGWTRPEVRVEASIERGSLETVLTGNRVWIQARSRWRDMGKARYELSVPVGTRVSASSVSGDVMVRATAGEVTIRTVSGDAALTDAADRWEVATVSGDVRVGKARGRGRVESVSGQLDLRDVTGTVAAKTVSGDVDVRDARVDDLRVQTVSGDVAFDGGIAPTGSYELNTHSGELRLTLPADASARVALQTFSGELRSAFPITLQPGASAGRRGRREFTVGGGAARLDLETFSGDITIDRAPAGRKE